MQLWTSGILTRNRKCNYFRYASRHLQSENYLLFDEWKSVGIFGCFIGVVGGTWNISSRALSARRDQEGNSNIIIFSSLSDRKSQTNKSGGFNVLQWCYAFGRPSLWYLCPRNLKNLRNCWESVVWATHLNRTRNQLFSS